MSDSIICFNNMRVRTSIIKEIKYMSTAVPKEKVFALTAAFSIVQSAVSQVTKYRPEKDDKVVFNALTKAIQKKGAKA